MSKCSRTDKQTNKPVGCQLDWRKADGLEMAIDSRRTDGLNQKMCFAHKSLWAICAPSTSLADLEVFSRHNSGTGSATDIQFSVLKVTWDALQFCSGEPKSYGACSTSFHQYWPTCKCFPTITPEPETGLTSGYSLPKATRGAPQSVFLLSQKKI
jgi:hypothetical protein